jgi:squalene-associated FAD-dependent desaturase
MSERSGRPVAVIGAGLAGLAAGLELALRNIPVRVYEQKPFAGGRAYSFVDRTSGETIDNGQHVLIAGYAATLRFLDLLGTSSLLRRQHRPTLLFHHPEKGFRRFSLPGLPTPLHLVAGIATTRLFSLPDRVRLLTLGHSLRRFKRFAEDLASVTVTDWLRERGQSPETIRSFWDPLTIAIMNERADRASALLFVRCLHRAFLEDRYSASLLIPSVGLSELFADPAVAAIRARGGGVALGTGISALGIEGNRVHSVKRVDGSSDDVSAAIVAVPPWSLGPLLPQGMVAASRFSPSPIVSVHLWFTRPFMGEPMVGIIGRTVQWAFDQRKIAEKGGGGGHISCVISAARDLVGQTNEEITKIAKADIRAVFSLEKESFLRGVVIREKRATFSPVPSLESYRPGTRTPVENLFLAGDWTATGLPGTIEGAVESGIRAAGCIQA